jgi:aspartyl-tRNA(Asn)/glutamyl-tRNA(Gln) amidotransferase subunit C
LISAGSGGWAAAETPMALDRDTVKHIAGLARIKLSDEELELTGHQLSRIIEWVEQLDEVDTEGVEPMTSVVEMELRLRADQVTDGGHPDKIVGNAPEEAHGFFAVPKVVE